MMAWEPWVEAHSYLRPVADLAAEIERAADGMRIPAADLPDWEGYRGDYLEGVPLLSSAAADIDLEPGHRIATACLQSLGPERRLIPGVSRWVVWAAMSRYLRPVMNGFDAWRDQERWLRRYCPTCGSVPAMAQLVGDDPGRMRLLSCGCCGTRWQFKRIGCPFCDANSQRLSTVAIEGEHGLRIDHCESCGGYIKTYDGQGDEALLLSDWSSLHLDLIAQERGLKKLAASLYELPGATSSSTP
jgi:FdhE protein